MTPRFVDPYARPQRGWVTAVNLAACAAITYLVSLWWGSEYGAGVLMANTFLTSDIITKEAMRVLVNNLVAARTVNRTYDEKFFRAGAKHGDKVRVRKPPRYKGRTGAAMQTEATKETFVYVSMEHEFGVDMEVSNWDLTLSLDNFSEKCIKPAAARIANFIDEKVCEKIALTVPYAVGTPGTAPTSLLTYGLATEKLNSNSAPKDDMLYMTVTSMMEVIIVDAAKTLFNATAEIAAQYRKGKMGRALGYEWQMDQNVFTFTTGPRGGTPLVNGASQTGATLITDGWTAAAANRVKKGDRFTLPSVNHVNPSNYQSTGSLQQFLITADGDSSGAGALTLNISPSITLTGAEQTVDVSPADNAALTFLGAVSTQTPCGFAHHKDVVALAMADLPMPKGVDMGGLISDEELGVSIRFIRDFETRTGQWLTRLDVIFGVSDLRSESLGCVIYGGN